jgi:tRNA/tmRNA/rRNA uracil-C5-methylase (TrmA/RlmC/RlmD family)
LVDVPYCHIATLGINNVLCRTHKEEREEARRGLLKKPSNWATFLRRDSNGAVEMNHTVYVNAMVMGLVFKFQTGNFFQNNPYILDLMVDVVIDAATRASPTTGGAMMHLIDCYCGSGLFCAGSSLHFDVCIGIKVNKMAISEAWENAALKGICNCDFVAVSAKAIFLSEVPFVVGSAIDDVKRRTTMTTKRRVVACYRGISPGIW